MGREGECGEGEEEYSSSGAPEERSTPPRPSRGGSGVSVPLFSPYLPRFTFFLLFSSRSRFSLFLDRDCEGKGKGGDATIGNWEGKARGENTAVGISHSRRGFRRPPAAERWTLNGNVKR
ncbi:hypothetical protein AKJ41_00920 [candidate division MSBL1 archaeon SCGC-AAA259O05]|uniref:Uncharacterized protein n=1 Tax=candidate division MSBL1 archaeon SCGC-AAA259O05 TaxID=1698271 RepID=A0A133V571_9EURY|nr:hypothetical protein AKJ41_00920 [candidate division MSBL1 archaeon SCGC-AAA259O05]